MIDKLKELVAPVRAATEKLKADERGLGELDTLDTELRVSEKELLPKAAAGDHIAGASITMGRFRLEAIPAERERLKKARPGNIEELWQATTATVNHTIAEMCEVIGAEGARLDATVLPVLVPLLAPGLSASVASYAERTVDGQRASSLIYQLRNIEADYPPWRKGTPRE